MLLCSVLTAHWRVATRHVTLVAVIRSFRHKGLKEVFRTGCSAKVPSELVDRIRRRLDVLDQAVELAEINLPGCDLHALSGHRPRRYAISVNGPWRITFAWDRGDAVAVDLEQYH
ncbi:MAG: type II toxin-antitoxin system RelE/ParE family toxin [Halofilum sp. (in: g-proteobacteria)]|nr:type II toxin-antitoxin system RelE/ParE family toxin [Halofilum sp. (in: g-proteobacteria)]